MYMMFKVTTMHVAMMNITMVMMFMILVLKLPSWGPPPILRGASRLDQNDTAILS